MSKKAILNKIVCTDINKNTYLVKLILFPLHTKDKILHITTKLVNNILMYLCKFFIYDWWSNIVNFFIIIHRQYNIQVEFGWTYHIL